MCSCECAAAYWPPAPSYLVRSVAALDNGGQREIVGGGGLQDIATCLKKPSVAFAHLPAACQAHNCTFGGFQVHALRCILSTYLLFAALMRK